MGKELSPREVEITPAMIEAVEAAVWNGREEDGVIMCDGGGYVLTDAFIRLALRAALKTLS
jgi:hypothetical protein